jgi:hypothetical protein
MSDSDGRPTPRAGPNPISTEDRLEPVELRSLSRQPPNLRRMFNSDRSWSPNLAPHMASQNADRGVELAQRRSWRTFLTFDVIASYPVG